MAKTLKDLLDDIKKTNADLKKFETKAVRIAGTESVRWIRLNFTNQSYKGAKWKPRLDKTNKAYDRRSGVKGSVFNSKNPILRQSGNLYDGIRYRAVSRNAYIGFDTNRIPYGRIHNEGGTIYVRNKVTLRSFFTGLKPQKKKKKSDAQTIIRMPKRQFMPKPSEPTDPDLLKMVNDKVFFEQEKLFSTFKK